VKYGMLPRRNKEYIYICIVNDIMIDFIDKTLHTSSIMLRLKKCFYDS